MQAGAPIAAQADDPCSTPNIAPTLLYTNVGVYRPSSAQFLLTTSEAAVVCAPDQTITYGTPGALPLAGKWTVGATADSIGVWHGGVFSFRQSLTDASTTDKAYGDAADTPLVGNWAGDGVDRPAVWRNGQGMFYLDNNDVTQTVLFGNSNDTPLAGDWDGNGVDGVGVRREGMLYLTNTLSGVGEVYQTAFYGLPSDVAVVGVWRELSADEVPPPVVCSVPTATPTTTPEPFAVYHVKCGLTPDARARTFPTLHGQVVRTFPPGTTLFVFETRLTANNANEDSWSWSRITSYGEYNGLTLWTASSNLDVGVSQSCAQNTPIPATAITPFPTPTRTFPIVPPGCATGRLCPHTSPNAAAADILAFVLACEAGNDTEDATALAHLIRNRANSGTYADDVYNVIRQSGQWQCYMEGATETSGLITFSNIPEPIKAIAQQLLNNQPLPTAFAQPIQQLGLYTYGAGPYPLAPTPTPSTYTVIANLSQDNQGPCKLDVTKLTNIYLAHTPLGTRAYTTIYFADDHKCRLP